MSNLNEQLDCFNQELQIKKAINENNSMELQKLEIQTQRYIEDTKSIVYLLTTFWDYAEDQKALLQYQQWYLSDIQNSLV